MNYTERDLIELVCRAPACPEWFEPDTSGILGDELAERAILLFGEDYKDTNWKHPQYWPSFFENKEYRGKYQIAQKVQWPRAYARMVLEAK